MEHIDCNTWIVMLRFTVVPLFGFEAFGVVSAGATSTYMFLTRLKLTVRLISLVTAWATGETDR